jgi:hypothetical protein
MVAAETAFGAFRVFLFLFLFWGWFWFGLSSFIESGYSFVFGLLPLTLVSRTSEHVGPNEMHLAVAGRGEEEAVGSSPTG